VDLLILRGVRAVLPLARLLRVPPLHPPVLEPDLHLGVRQAQRGRQLPPVRLGDVLLQLKPPLQALPLQVAEDRPRPGPLPLVALGERQSRRCRRRRRHRDPHGCNSGCPQSLSNNVFIGAFFSETVINKR
jgi:hypothetical protein